MPLLHFDWTINPGNVITLLVAIGGLGKILMAVRDTLRELTAQIGGVDDGKHVRTGILGELANMQEDFTDLRTITTEHRTWLLQHREWLVSHGFDRRTQPQRRHADSVTE